MQQIPGSKLMPCSISYVLQAFALIPIWRTNGFAKVALSVWIAFTCCGVTQKLVYFWMVLFIRKEMYVYMFVCMLVFTSAIYVIIIKTTNLSDLNVVLELSKWTHFVKLSLLLQICPAECVGSCEHCVGSLWIRTQIFYLTATQCRPLISI